MLLNKKICLFCMGAYGMRTFFLLKECGISVSFFGDNSFQKIGKTILGITCLSLKDCLALSKDEYQIIVCNKEPDELYRIFLEAGFSVFECKYVWKKLYEKREVKMAEIWDSQVELKKLHSVIMKIYTEETFENIQLQYGSSLLSDLISIKDIQ